MVYLEARAERHGVYLLMSSMPLRQGVPFSAIHFMNRLDAFLVDLRGAVHDDDTLMIALRDEPD